MTSLSPSQPYSFLGNQQWVLTQQESPHLRRRKSLDLLIRKVVTLNEGPISFYKSCVCTSLYVAHSVHVCMHVCVVYIVCMCVYMYLCGVSVYMCLCGVYVVCVVQVCIVCAFVYVYVCIVCVNVCMVCVWVYSTPQYRYLFLSSALSETVSFLCFLPQAWSSWGCPPLLPITLQKCWDYRCPPYIHSFLWALGTQTRVLTQALLPNELSLQASF